MAIGKRKLYKQGSIVKIKLPEGRLAFGRLLPGYHIGVYDFIMMQDGELPSIESIISHPVFLYCGIYKDIITKGIFEIIGFKELTQPDLDAIPPSFTQSLGNMDDCEIYYYDGRARKASPEECINLERSSVWEAEGVINRIQSFYSGKKHPNVELQKVILLSKDDPRYLNPRVRWDFKEEKFYKE